MANDISTAAELERVVFVLGETNRPFRLVATATSLHGDIVEVTLRISATNR